MRRRALLGSLGASLSFVSGCQERGGLGSDGSCSIPGRRRVSVGDRTDFPAEVGVSVKLRLETGGFTRSRPVQLTISIKNTGNQIYTKYTDDDQCHPFNREAGRSDPRGLWLYRHQDTPSSDTGACWQEDTPPQTTRTFSGYACAPSEVPAGESIVTGYDVWDDYATEGYFQPGTYRFETTIPIQHTPGDDQELTRYDWWFELDVTTS